MSLVRRLLGKLLFQGTAKEEVGISWVVFDPSSKAKTVQANCTLATTGFAKVVFDPMEENAKCLPM